MRTRTHKVGGPGAVSEATLSQTGERGDNYHQPLTNYRRYATMSQATEGRAAVFRCVPPLPKD